MDSMPPSPISMHFALGEADSSAGVEYAPFPAAKAKVTKGNRNSKSSSARVNSPGVVCSGCAGESRTGAAAGGDPGCCSSRQRCGNMLGMAPDGYPASKLPASPTVSPGRKPICSGDIRLASRPYTRLAATIKSCSAFFQALILMASCLQLNSCREGSAQYG